MTTIVEVFNQRVIDAHNAHYINSPTGLVDLSVSATPNENQIYHLYSSGKITHQKGAWAYLHRTEFTIKQPLPFAKLCSFQFALVDETIGSSYSILTLQECELFRQEMENIILQHK